MSTSILWSVKGTFFIPELRVSGQLPSPASPTLESSLGSVTSIVKAIDGRKKGGGLERSWTAATKLQMVSFGTEGSDINNRLRISK